MLCPHVRGETSFALRSIIVALAALEKKRSGIASSTTGRAVRGTPRITDCGDAFLPGGIATGGGTSVHVGSRFAAVFGSAWHGGWFGRVVILASSCCSSKVQVVCFSVIVRVKRYFVVKMPQTCDDAQQGSSRLAASKQLQQRNY